MVIAVIPLFRFWRIMKRFVHLCRNRANEKQLDDLAMHIKNLIHATHVYPYSEQNLDYDSYYIINLELRITLNAWIGFVFSNTPLPFQTTHFSNLNSAHMWVCQGWPQFLCAVAWWLRGSSIYILVMNIMLVHRPSIQNISTFKSFWSPTMPSKQYIINLQIWFCRIPSFRFIVSSISDHSHTLVLLGSHFPIILIFTTSLKNVQLHDLYKINISF